MSDDQREYAARSASIFKCDHCHAIHLRCEINDNVFVIVNLDPDQWADMLMADPEFRREAVARLK